VDREQTAEARAWSTELFYAGEQTVILIPTLPVALARRVTEIVARELRGTAAPDLFQLLGLVRNVRGKIFSFRPPSSGPDTPDLRAGMKANELSAALRELSLEVTLFTRSWIGQVENRFTGFAP
jgi:hypothetical protein